MTKTTSGLLVVFVVVADGGGGAIPRTAQQMIKKTSRLHVSTALHSLSAAEKSVPRGSQRSRRRPPRPSTDRTCRPRKSEKRGKDHWHLLLE